uniref:Cat1 n=1 Tax=Arundo donax TaxID=35708 RepID=A0A0A9CT79_ARUDO
MTGRVKPRWEVVDLLIPVHEVHEAIMVVVVVSTFRCIHRKHQIVGAETVPLGISIGENSRLEQLIIRIVDSRDNNCWAESNLFILCKEVINVLVQHHPPNRLQGDDILWPGLGDIKWVKVKFILMIRINGLDVKLPFWVIPSCNRII